MITNNVEKLFYYIVDPSQKSRVSLYHVIFLNCIDSSSFMTSFFFFSFLLSFPNLSSYRIPNTILIDLYPIVLSFVLVSLSFIIRGSHFKKPVQNPFLNILLHSFFIKSQTYKWTNECQILKIVVCLQIYSMVWYWC